jgi:hypothetical protein
MTTENMRMVLVCAAMIGCLPFSHSSAQMYRCGNVYQDRPCDGPQAGKQVSPGASTSAKASNAPADASAAPVTYPECARRGADSQKIVWARENGETEEKMSAAETSTARKKLIADVYRVRGTAPQVRTRIEAECNVELAERAKLLALQEAMVKAGVTAPQATAPAAPAAKDGETAAARRAKIIAAENKSMCDQLNLSRESILQRQRSGGSASRMDSLNRERDTVDQEIQKLGCSRMK